MNVLDPGYTYVLDDMDGHEHQLLSFIMKKADTSGKMVTIRNGTTTEEVLSVLIDRLMTLNAKFPCRQNSLAITKLQEALFWLEDRRRERAETGKLGRAIA